MARRRHQPQFHEPSLVPLADMLTNTVGIVVFILIFTVLTTNGAMITKRLPMEHEVNIETTEYYICANGRIYPLRDTSIHKLLGKKIDKSEFLALANGSVIEDEDEFIKLTLTIDHQGGTRIIFVAQTKPQAGLLSSQIMNADDFLTQDIGRLATNKGRMVFWVKPDSIAVFKAARDAAVSAGIAYNWSPKDPDKPLSFSISSGGSGTVRGL